MAMQISELDLTDLAVLEDQLTGVDTAYFLQLIEKLKEKDPDEGERGIPGRDHRPDVLTQSSFSIMGVRHYVEDGSSEDFVGAGQADGPVS
jgi:hypothetical protein